MTDTDVLKTGGTPSLGVKSRPTKLRGEERRSISLPPGHNGRESSTKGLSPWQSQTSSIRAERSTDCVQSLMQTSFERSVMKRYTVVQLRCFWRRWPLGRGWTKDIEEQTSRASQIGDNALDAWSLVNLRQVHPTPAHVVDLLFSSSSPSFKGFV